MKGKAVRAANEVVDDVKRAIDAGTFPGPHMDVTGPYLEGANSPFIQMHALTDANDATRTLNFWADQGVTSLKAYMNITRAELKAAVEEAHRRGLKAAGHDVQVPFGVCDTAPRFSLVRSQSARSPQTTGSSRP